MPIFSTSLNNVNSTKLLLSTNFNIKDLDKVNMILKIKVISSKDGIMLSQEHSAERLLKKFECFDMTPIDTPYDANFEFKKNYSDPIA